MVEVRFHSKVRSLTSGVNFTNVLHTASMLVDPESVKNTVKSLISFYPFRICERKNST